MANYSDIEFNLTPTEFNDISLVEDLESIKQSIKTIVLTKRGARTKYQNPTFGTDIYTLLFEKASTITASLIRKEIELAIGNDEPRVEEVDVEVTSATNNNYEITITYRVIAVQVDDSVTFTIDIIK